jgi:hypothetical protein
MEALIILWQITFGQTGIPTLSDDESTDEEHSSDAEEYDTDDSMSSAALVDEMIAKIRRFIEAMGFAQKYTLEYEATDEGEPIRVSYSRGRYMVHFLCWDVNTIEEEPRFEYEIAYDGSNLEEVQSRSYFSMAELLRDLGAWFDADAHFMQHDADLGLSDHDDMDEEDDGMSPPPPADQVVAEIRLAVEVMGFAQTYSLQYKEANDQGGPITVSYSSGRYAVHFLYKEPNLSEEEDPLYGCELTYNGTSREDVQIPSYYSMAELLYYLGEWCQTDAHFAGRYMDVELPDYYEML